MEKAKIKGKGYDGRGGVKTTVFREGRTVVALQVCNDAKEGGLNGGIGG